MINAIAKQMEENTDKAGEEIQEDKSPQQSEEGQKELSLGEVAELAKNIQQGMTKYTQHWTDRLSGMEGQLAEIAQSINKQTGAQLGDDEYLTAGKLNQILDQREQSKAQVEAQRTQQIEKQIEDNLQELYSDGIITSDKERDNLLQFAVDNKILDLNKAAAKWVKEQGNAKVNDVARAKARQEEGSKVGTSSKQSGESKGIEYSKIHNTDWDNL